MLIQPVTLSDWFQRSVDIISDILISHMFRDVANWTVRRADWGGDGGKKNIPSSVKLTFYDLL